MAYAATAEHSLTQAGAPGVLALQRALVWLAGASGAIVFIEPSPYELVTLVADNPAPPSAGTDATAQVSGRPDFQVLVYPGPLGIPAKAVKGAPPAFITAGTLDQCCAAPAMTLYTQLRDAGVSAELHLWADIGHGFNVAAHSERLSIQHWPDRLADWLSDEGLLTPGDAEVAKPVP